MITIESREQLACIVEKQVEKSIDKLFRKLHKKTKTKRGDINPFQMSELEELLKQLAAIITQQVWQNIA